MVAAPPSSPPFPYTTLFRSVLLPVTPVRAAEDVHAVVSTIQQRASAILSSELGLDPKATMGFAMALSESCQNIVEQDRKSTRLNSSHLVISYAVFCLKKKIR